MELDATLIIDKTLYLIIWVGLRVWYYKVLHYLAGVFCLWVLYKIFISWIFEVFT